MKEISKGNNNWYFSIS